MRTFTLPLLLVALPALAGEPENLQVVVHTADKVVLDYTCDTWLSPYDPAVPVLHSDVQSPGMFNWHAVGGTAPYIVVRTTASDLSTCITVRDAVGNVTTGCGIVNEVHVRRTVQCHMDMDSIIPAKEESNKVTIYPPPPPNPPVHPKTIDPKKPTKSDPPPNPPDRNATRHVRPVPPPGPHTSGGNDHYRTPGRDHAPDPPPSPGHGSTGHGQLLLPGGNKGYGTR